MISDPDRLLAGEELIRELTRRGFRIVQETDPVLFHHYLEEMRPYTPERPVIIITSGALENLPYDIYQPSYRLSFSLHQYFPNLAYPVLQSLTPDQIEKLEFCAHPTQALSRQKTIDYLLREVFDADPVLLRLPSALIAWINKYHQSRSTLPEILRSSLVVSLKSYAVYREWELDSLIRDHQVFLDFIQQEWTYSIQNSFSSETIHETRSDYHLTFNRDPQLQDMVPSLVRVGTIQPVEISEFDGLPPWAHPGVTLTDARLNRYTSLLVDIENHLQSMNTISDTQPDWKFWVGFAKDWAELCSINYQIDVDINQEQRETFHRIVRELDKNFSVWLKKNYVALGSQRLPKPHHVFHIPHYLAYLRDLGRLQRVILVILDGFSLADWQVAKSEWSKRHKNWQIQTDPLLAQVPTITSISRYAMISGLRPAEFASDLDHIAPESRAWELFWSREGIAEVSCKLMSLAFDRGFDQLPELQDPRISYWCLIEDTPDKLAHNATLGAADQQSSLRLWLDPAHDQNSLPLEKLIDSFLDRGYSVFISSDHGHVEASGFGQPSEGLLAQTRGKRARIYKDRLAAKRVQTTFIDTTLWENDGILPDQITALMPSGRNAFAPSGEVVVTHGGTSIDEVIVPLIEITKASS
jgi:hypothetical protein